MVKSLLYTIRPRAEEIEREDPLPVVKLTSVQAKRFVLIRRYYGEIEPSREARLAFEVSGRLREIYSRENALVGTDRPLAELDPVLFETRRDREKAQLAKANRDLERSRELRKKKFVPHRNLQDAETAVRLYSAGLKEATEQLARTKLYSPFAGYIVRREVECGEMVRSGQHAFTVMELDRVKLVVWVPEYRIPELAGQQVCQIQMPAFPGRSFSGQVNRVPLASKHNGRMFGVEIVIPNKDRSLRPGMIAQARIETLTLESAWRFPIGWVRRGARGLEVSVFEPVGEAGEGKLGVVRLIKPFRDGSHWVASGLAGVRQGSVLEVVTVGFEGLHAGRRVRRLGQR